MLRPTSEYAEQSSVPPSPTVARSMQSLPSCDRWSSPPCRESRAASAVQRRAPLPIAPESKGWESDASAPERRCSPGEVSTLRTAFPESFRARFAGCAAAPRSAESVCRHGVQLIWPYGQSIERIFTIDEESIECILIADRRYFGVQI